MLLKKESSGKKRAALGEKKMGPKLMRRREGVREDGNRSKESAGGINGLKPYHQLIVI